MKKDIQNTFSYFIFPHQFLDLLIFRFGRKVDKKGLKKATFPRFAAHVDLRRGLGTLRGAFWVSPGFLGGALGWPAPS